MNQTENWREKRKHTGQKKKKPNKGGVGGLNPRDATLDK